MNNSDHDSLPIDHPKTAAVLGYIYDHLFQPVLNLMDKVHSGWTKRFINENSLPEDKN